ISRSSLRRRAGGEEIDHHVAAAFADREGMGPDFRPGAGTLDSSRDPAATGTVERKFDHDSGAILAGLRPHPRAPAIARRLDQLDPPEAAAMQIRQMLPVERVFVEPFDTGVKFASIGPDVRNSSFKPYAVAHPQDHIDPALHREAAHVHAVAGGAWLVIEDDEMMKFSIPGWVCCRSSLD